MSEVMRRGAEQTALVAKAGEPNWRPYSEVSDFKVE